MAIIKRSAVSLILSALFMSSFTTAEAQRRISYEQLAGQQREQSIFFDYFTLPGSEEGTVQFVTTFRVDYNLLPFKKTNNPESEYMFFSPAGMSIEIFKDSKGDSRSRRRKDDFSIEGLEPVARAFWKDTAFAENYEQTKSKNKFKEGYLATEIQPGEYSYILQFTRGQEVDGESSRKRTIDIHPYREKKRGKVLLAENYSGSGTSEKIKLLNFGSNVYYGKDFYAFVHLPGFKDSDRYRYTIGSVDISDRDTTRLNTVLSSDINQDNILSGVLPEITSTNGSLYLDIHRTDHGEAYLLLKIPNSTFQNSVYRLQVFKNDGNAPLARSIFRSKWIEMPTSLLNVDIAIEMLRYITDEKTLRRLSEGSNSAKEKKFREFWSKRDPTPNTEFNELMAEYYRRIDYAYEQFSTVNVNGYNTDQGRIYIQYGPPNNIERKFPPGEPAIEIWNYGDRTFVFRAISGFGQFELVKS